MRSAKRWREPGLLVETLPADQDRRQTPPARSLATSLPWQEVATLFRCAWGTVERAVEDAVSYGLAYRDPHERDPYRHRRDLAQEVSQMLINEIKFSSYLRDSETKTAARGFPRNGHSISQPSPSRIFMIKKSLGRSLNRDFHFARRIRAFIHQHASPHARFLQPHVIPLPTPVRWGRARRETDWSPCFQGISQAPLHTCALSSPLRCTQAARQPPGTGSAQILRSMSPNSRRVRCPSASRSQ